jgi:hypothetical protein
MGLNTLAGRSFHDLCQYPVMPWVIAQYTAQTIDLKDPNTYRDLSKPIGAINDKRLDRFLERYQSCKDDIPPFMYGSHYSTMVGVVLHFLIRLQPFASLHAQIQNGHFDVPDRLFCSIPQAWEHNTTLLSEVKELTPEWFLFPDFLRNINNFEFGEMQNGQLVNDVELPPWASSPEEFIRINREALESEYVSQHLHEWIDLIFGFKQRGPHAVEAHNVFYYLTYYGAVNRNLITDEATKSAIELQIAHFGQCPMQLFRVPHPRKSIRGSVPRPLRNVLHPLMGDPDYVPTLAERLSCDARCTYIIRTNPTASSSSSIISSANIPIILDVLIRRHQLVCVLDTGHLEVFTYNLSDTARTILVNVQRGTSSKSSSSDAAKTEKDYQKMKSGGDVILFDDAVPALSMGPEPSLPSVVEELEIGVPSSKSKKPLNPTGRRDVLVSVEKVAPSMNIRLPILPPSSHATRSADLIDFSKEGTPHLSHQRNELQFTSSHLLLSAGLSDGSVRVQDFASFTSKKSPHLSGGAFFGHKCQVIALACDELVGSHTDVIASCDVSGQILVWTITRLVSSKQRLILGAIDERRVIISRRPQRVFTTLPSQTICCDVSWQMGVVASASHGLVTIFSIERNERFHLLDIQQSLLSAFPNQPSSDIPKPPTLWRNRCEVDIKRLLLVDDGFIVLYVESGTRFPNVRTIHSLGTTSSDNFRYLILISLMGRIVRIVECLESITFLSCPSRNDLLVCGFMDGLVSFLSTFTLETLFQFSPHECCLASDIKVGSRDEAPRFQTPTRGASITSIRLGPNLKRPTLVSITSATGGFYIRALPDFVQWQRTLQQSGLAQIVQAPMQAVKETIHQAQHLSMVASDAATAMASNAKSFADETLSKVQCNCCPHLTHLHR